MKIETDVPLPESSRARKYPFLEMSVGESVYFDGEEVNGRAYRAAMSTGQATQSKVCRPPRGQWPSYLEGRIVSDVDVQALVDNHLDLMKIVDKLNVIKLLKKAIEDPSYTVESLVEYLHKARVDSYNIGAGKTDPFHGLTKRHGEKHE
jgi:hypothetical protein